MAKSKHDTGTTITTPSPYGSHASMVVEELDENRVVCQDDNGLYITTKDRLDTGMADGNRYGRKLL